jgi:hypothetical protein
MVCPEDNIKVETLESGSPQIPHRDFGLLDLATSVDQGQGGGVEALHAHADTVDASPAQDVEFLWLLRGDARGGLDADGEGVPGVLGERGDSLTDPFKLLGRQAGRRASADIDAADLGAAQPVGMAVQFAQEGVDVADVDLLIRTDVHGEVAIEALGLAERHMEVEQGLRSVVQPITG